MSTSHPKQPTAVDSKAKDKPKQDIGYYRVLGIQKEKNGANSTPTGFSKYDKLPSPSFNPMNLFSGEKKEDRVTRVKMNYYKQLLQSDMKLAEKAYSNHVGRYESLQIEFAEQKGQLTRWGLESLMKNFRMQSWLRQSRGELLMNMTKHIIHTLQTKLADVTDLVAFLNNKNSSKESNKVQASTGGRPDTRKRLDGITDEFFASPESLLEKDKEFLRKRQRLSAIDKLCHMASAKFRESLPELNSKDFAERSKIVSSIVKRYGNLLDSKNLCMDSEIAMNGSWHDFSLWYQQKSSKELQLYDEFLQFIDDEREREGRLFRRWCNLVGGSSAEVDLEESAQAQGGAAVLVDAEGATGGVQLSGCVTGATDQAVVATSAIASIDLSELKANDKGAPEKSGSSKSLSGSTTIGQTAAESNANSAEVDGKPVAMEANAAYMIYPKSVKTFIQYFAFNIIAPTYSIPQPLHSALLALTETVIHRTVHQSLFRYPSVELLKKDRAWRAHALRCRHVDPMEYHSAPKHLGIRAAAVDEGVPRPPTSLEQHIAKVMSIRSPRSDPSSAAQAAAAGAGAGGGAVSTDGADVNPPNTYALDALAEEVEEDEHGTTTPTKATSSTAPAMRTPPSASSTSSKQSATTDYSITPPPSPLPPPPSHVSSASASAFAPPRKEDSFSQSPSSSNDNSRKGGGGSGSRSSSVDAQLASSSRETGSRLRITRSRSSSTSGLSALGGKTAYCDSILKNFAIIRPLHKRMEYLLPNSLDKVSPRRSTGADEAFAGGEVENRNEEGDIQITSASIAARGLGNDSIISAPRPLLMINLRPAVVKSLGSSFAINAKSHVSAGGAEVEVAVAGAGLDGVVALYALPARMLGLVQLAVSPREVIVIILLTIQWLTRTAYELLACAGRKKEALGADDMFPLLVNVLANSNIPNIHLIMHYLQTYTAMESFGEAAYYVTSMGAAVEFIDTSYAEGAEGEEEDGAGPHDLAREKDEEEFKQESLNIIKEKELGEAAVNHLGEWLRDQQVMEDTMVVMMQEGWMG